MAGTAEQLSELKCALTKEVVRAQGRVHLRVTGLSMVPTVLPGDTLTVERKAVEEVQSGQIVLLDWEGRLCAHRVVEKQAHAGGVRLVTRGDATGGNDPPVEPERVLGVVTAIERGRARFQPGLKVRAWRRIFRLSPWPARIWLRLRGLL
jgi:signal peptidase I